MSITSHPITPRRAVDMANGRNVGKKHDSGRDSGGFVALPFSVLDSPAYLSLSVHAKALLLEVARQYRKEDNGRMLLSRAHLAPRGWNSSDMIMKAKRELLAADLIFETVKGARPNKASWYAVTWRALDRNPDYDFGAAQAFVRGAYRLKQPLKAPQKNASLKPPHGTGKAPIAPPHGTETLSPVPPHGAIRSVITALSVPPHGHPLDLPSKGAHWSGPGLKVEKAGARSANAALLPNSAKLMLCQHGDCETLTLGHDFCAKHRQQANGHTAAQRHLDAKGTQ